ncbi:MAG TPA: aromatic ring-hydroxylating dioxygenase subunit alpha [Acidimicrobiales bacterium]|nr:aromatic ring-hydroxylating dioxygenase subunit alpha [Acidimicrobiales bacterium]
MPAGRLPAEIFNSPVVFDLEQERVFSRVWLFLAHESELPDPGDYVLRSLAGNSVIVARSESGDIGCFLNMCRHRGNQVCKASEGNASHFRCSYHGWTYTNTGQLIGVPQIRTVYDKTFDRDDWGLLPVRTETYAGLVFGCIDPDAPSLDEYLGGFQFYLDLYLRPGPNGTEAYAPPDRWVADVDWKICAENFAGDGYHTPVAHQFGFQLGYYASSASTHAAGYAVHIPGKGHGIGLGRTPGMPPFFGYPDDVVALMEQQLTEEQLSIFRETRTAVGTVFPNLSLLIQPFSTVPGEPGLRFCTMRLWQPIGVGRMQMLSWCLVPTDASDEYKREAYRAYTLAFGHAGMFEQDDFDNWSRVTRMAGSPLSRDVSFPYLMGLGHEPLPDFPGPGVAVQPYVTETNFRNLWQTWFDLLEQP